ncbi:hypothetical protein, partial [Mycobacterium tuberculosis]
MVLPKPTPRGRELIRPAAHVALHPLSLLHISEPTRLLI